VDSTTGKRIGEPLQHRGADIVECAAFSPDGKTLVTGAGGFLWSWDVATGKSKADLLGHEEGVQAVAYSPDGSRILTGSRDGVARFWEAATGKPVGQPLQHKDTVWAVGYSRDGKKVLTGSSTEARVWDAEGSFKSLPHRAPVWALAFSPDGKVLLTGSGETGDTNGGEAQLWDAATGKPVGEIMRHKRAVFGVAFSRDGKTVLTREKYVGFEEIGQAVALAQVWDCATGRPIGEPIRDRYLGSATFSPTGRTILTGGSGSGFRLWDAATGRLAAESLRSTEDGREISIDHAAFSPDGKLIVTTGATLKKPSNGVDHYELRLWDPVTGKPVGDHVTLPAFVWCVAFSPDGKQVLTGSREKTAQLWDATSLRPIGVPLRHDGELRRVGFSADGKLILTLSDKVVQLWEAGTQGPVGRALEHRSRVDEAAFSPDSTMVATRTADGAALLWDARTGQRIGPPFGQRGVAEVQQFGRAVGLLAISPDGDRFAVAANKTAQIWRLPRSVEGEPERLALWTQLVTGMEIDEQRAVHVLDASTWQERARRLEELGGPPLR
jgi:WD40 repeat protein